MSNPPPRPSGKSSMERATFTITQLELGAALLWEPPVGTAEHDRLVDAYIAGPGSLQQKRATIALDFFDTVAASSLPAPFCRTYHVSVPVYAGYAMVRSSPISTTSLASSWSAVQPSAKSSPSSTSSKPAKRAREEASPPSSASKRLPGFSIMTKDGVDITDNQSRGPKTKEQREHAAKMRKLGACPACKRSKQKCEPSHHRPLASAESAPMSATPSSSSTLASCQTSSAGSRASISPATSFDNSFSPPSVVAHTGERFSPLMASKPGLSPSDLMMDMPLTNLNHADLGTFGFDLNFDDASLGADFSFQQTPFDQDFDLYSYDNTLDFDSFLNYTPPFNLNGEYSQRGYSNISPVAYDSGVVQPSGVVHPSRPTVRSQAQVQVYNEVDSEARASPSSYDSDQSISSHTSYSDQHDVWDGAALHGGSSYLTKSATDDSYSLYDHGIRDHVSSSSLGRKQTSIPPRKNIQISSEVAFTDAYGSLLESQRVRSESTHLRSQSSAAQGIYEESQRVRSESAPLRSQSPAAQDIYEMSSQPSGTIARRTHQDSIGIPSGTPMEDIAGTKTKAEKSQNNCRYHTMVERNEVTYRRHIMAEWCRHHTMAERIDVNVNELTQDPAQDVRNHRLTDRVRSHPQLNTGNPDGVPSTLVSQLAVAVRKLSTNLGLDGLIRGFSSLRVGIA